MSGTSRIAEMMAGVNKQGKIEGRDEAHGKLPMVALRIERLEGERYGFCSSFLYGLLVGGPVYDPDKGIQFVMQGWAAHGWDAWEKGVWKVTVEGKELREQWTHIAQGRMEYIRVGEVVKDVSAEMLEEETEA